VGAVSRIAAGAAFVAAGVALIAVTYRLALREWCLTWGARPDEVARPMPGDDLLHDAGLVATRAVAIDAPPAAVWPWLVQMGSGRAGAYTYDWIENLFGLDMRSADRVVPELQDVHVGDVLPMNPGAPGLRVEVLDPERAFVLRSEDGRWVWAFGLYPEDGSTRLVSRNRISTEGASAAGRAANALMEPGSLVMERKMLLGIKERAERLHRESPPR
jgi:hypothetical protein